MLRINIEGDDVFYGQALFPVPAEDPNDPLQVCFHIANKQNKAKNTIVGKLEEDNDPYCLLRVLVLG